MLDITGIESGDLRLSAEPVRVSEAVEEVARSHRPAGRRTPASSCSSDRCDAWRRFVHADRQRLKQVLLNLVANAVKYNREGGSVRIDLRARERERCASS